MEYLKYFNMGLMAVSPAIVGLIAGMLLDNAFNTHPVLTVALLLLGVISGMWSSYKSIKGLLKE